MNYLFEESEEESDPFSHFSKSLIGVCSWSGCFSKNFSVEAVGSHEWNAGSVSPLWGCESFDFSRFLISAGVWGKVPQALRNFACKNYNLAVLMSRF